MSWALLFAQLTMWAAAVSLTGACQASRNGSSAPAAAEAGAPLDAGRDGGGTSLTDDAMTTLLAQDGGRESRPAAGLTDAGRSRPDDGYFDGLSVLDELPTSDCRVEVSSASVSPEIPTVGVVSFSTDLPNLRRAEVHFGLDRSYGLVAPVDLSEPGYRTLLLGMTEEQTFHYRVAVSDGTSTCYGEDATLSTGVLQAKGLAEAMTSEGAAPGFIVTARDGEAVIYNKAGELVWAYPMWNVFSAKMSWDGKYMFGRDPGPFDLATGGTFYRVTMDGSEVLELDAPGGDHHDFAAIPGGIAYLAKPAAGECDWVFEANTELSDGRPRFDTWQIFQHFPDEGMVEGAEICHANRINYLHDKGVYTVSDRNKDAIAVFSRAGEPITSIGKAPSGAWTKHIRAQGAGPYGDWHVQHGHHWYSDTQLVVFSNESKDGAAALHYTIDADQATLDWKYLGAGESRIQGDVQRLPNGNFLVTANLSNSMIELAPDGQTVLGRYVLDGPIGPFYGFTYATHRSSLYGAPAPR